MSDFGWWGEYTKEEAMKVQRKVSAGVQYEVIEEAPSYYIVKDILGTVVVPKTDYEPVQEWVDVTKYCNLLEDGYGRYSLFHHTCAIQANDPLYRVTRQGSGYKVEVKK